MCVLATTTTASAGARANLLGIDAQDARFLDLCAPCRARGAAMDDERLRAFAPPVVRVVPA